MNGINTLAAVLIPCYILAIVITIMVIGRRNKNYKDFALGGGQLPWYISAGSMIAALIGGGTMIGYVGAFYNYGLQWAWMGIIAAFAMLFLGLYLSERIRNLNCTTVADMIYLRYGKPARVMTSIIIIFGDFAVFCAMISSFSKLLSGYIGLPVKIALAISVIIFMISANVGGLKGVAYTDLVQSILIIGGILIVAFVALKQAGGFAGIGTLDKNMLDPFAENVPWVTMAGNVVSLAAMLFVSQSTIMQKLNATRSAKDAKKAVVTMAICSGLAIAFLIGCMGIASRVIFGPGIEVADDVVVQLLANVPALLGTIYAAAILAAVLTTANAMLLSSSVTFSNDLLKVIKPNVTDKQSWVYSRVFIIIAGICGYIIVQFIPGVITWILLTYTIQACMIVPLYGGLFSKKPNGKVGFAALLISSIGVVVWQLLQVPYGIHSVFIAIGLGLLTLIIGPLFCKGGVTKEQEQVVDAFVHNQPFVRE